MTPLDHFLPAIPAIPAIMLQQPSKIHVSASYIVDQEIYITPPKMIVKDPPYHTEADPPMQMIQVDADMKQRTMDAFRNVKMSLYESTIIYVVAMGKYIGFYHVPKQGTWAEFTYQVMKSLRDANIMLHIKTYQLGFSNEPVYRPNQTKILDTRKGTPYEVVPSFSVLHVVLGHVEDFGWIPLHRANCCFQCGLLENPFGQGRLKRCKACQCAMYCSKECQLADWKAHKQHCIGNKSNRA